MTYTSHGHHIEGTEEDPRKPYYVYHCGGPKLCPTCSHEAATVNREKCGSKFVVSIYPTTTENGLEKVRLETYICCRRQGHTTYHRTINGQTWPNEGSNHNG